MLLYMGHKEEKVLLSLNFGVYNWGIDKKSIEQEE